MTEYMSPEERALATAKRVNSTWETDTTEETAAIIAYAIRQATNDALEFAASVAFAYFDPEWPGDELSRQAESIRDDILARKLKHAEPPHAD